MWTQIKETTLSSFTTNNISLASSASSLGIKVGMWLVITPYSQKCQIRKVVSINTNGSVNISPNITVGNHSNTSKVYIQTSPVWDIRLFGASPIETPTNNRISIQNAVDDCDFCGGGTVGIPKGEYVITHASLNFCINLRGRQNLNFEGEGIGLSILKIYGISYSQSVNMFSCYKENGVYSKNIIWRKMTLIGNYPFDAEEQSHLINISGNNDDGDDCKDFSMSDVEFRTSYGDGIFLLNAYNVNIINCSFIKNHRSGVTLQRGNFNVKIKGCYFYHTNDQDIDGEPTGADETKPSPRMINTTNNIFIRKTTSPSGTFPMGVTITGKRKYEREELQIFSNNILVNSNIQVNDCKSVIISNNILEGLESTGAQNLIIVLAKIKRFLMSDNIFINRKQDSMYVLNFTSKFYQNPDADPPEPPPYFQYTPQYLLIKGNFLKNGGASFTSCSDVLFVGNKVDEHNITPQGLIFDISPYMPSGYNYGNLMVLNNEFTNSSEFAVMLLSDKETDRYKQLLIDNNTASGKDLKAGIVVEKASAGTGNLEYWDLLMVGKGNQMQTKKVVDAIDVYGSYLIGETPNNDEWITDGNPEVLTDTWQGTQAIDKNQSADNKSQHNKLDGNEGWTLVSEMGKQILFEDEFNIIFNPPAPYLLAYDSVNNQHEPNINVFSSINPWSVPQGVWKIDETDLFAYTDYGSGASIALLDALVNCEIKMIIELISPGTGSNCGIEFRHASLSNYWRFSIVNDSGDFYARLYKGSSQIFTTSLLTIPDSNTFVLKVKLNGSFISIFLNDLLLFTTNDAAYIGATKHGMRSNSNKYYVHSFKIIK